MSRTQLRPNRQNRVLSNPKLPELIFRRRTCSVKVAELLFCGRSFGSVGGAKLEGVEVWGVIRWGGMTDDLA